MLAYFHEAFEKGQCKGTCDNCWSGRCVACESRDVSTIGQASIGMLRQCRGRVTLAQLVDAAKGSKNKVIADKGLVAMPGYGVASSLKKHEIERILKTMLAEGFLGEGFEINENFGGCTGYLELGPKSNALGGGAAKLWVPFATSSARAGGPTLGALDVEGGDAGGAGGGGGDGTTALLAQLEQDLQQLRHSLRKTEVNLWNVYSNPACKDISTKLPLSHQQLEQCTGMGKAKVQKFGDAIIQMVTKFVTQHPLLEPLAAPNRTLAVEQEKARVAAEAAEAKAKAEKQALKKRHENEIAASRSRIEAAEAEGKRRRVQQPEFDDPDFAPSARPAPKHGATGGGAGGGGGGNEDQSLKARQAELRAGGGGGKQRADAFSTHSPYFGGGGGGAAGPAACMGGGGDDDADGYLFGDGPSPSGAMPNGSSGGGSSGMCDDLDDAAFLAMDIPGEPPPAQRHAAPPPPQRQPYQQQPYQQQPQQQQQQHFSHPAPPQQYHHTSHPPAWQPQQHGQAQPPQHGYPQQHGYAPQQPSTHAYPPQPPHWQAKPGPPGGPPNMYQSYSSMQPPAGHPAGPPPQQRPQQQQQAPPPQQQQQPQPQQQQQPQPQQQQQAQLSASQRPAADGQQRKKLSLTTKKMAPTPDLSVFRFQGPE